jgi:hypothetical protein
VDDIDQASVKISWKQANDISHDTVYRIECNRLIEGRLVPCESYISYQPNRTFINGTRYSINLFYFKRKSFVFIVSKFWVLMPIQVIILKYMLNKYRHIY